MALGGVVRGLVGGAAVLVLGVGAPGAALAAPVVTVGCDASVEVTPGTTVALSALGATLATKVFTPQWLAERGLRRAPGRGLHGDRQGGGPRGLRRTPRPHRPGAERRGSGRAARSRPRWRCPRWRCPRWRRATPGARRKQPTLGRREPAAPSCARARAGSRWWVRWRRQPRRRDTRPRGRPGADRPRCRAVRCGAVGHGTSWFGTSCFGTIEYGASEQGPSEFGNAGRGHVRAGDECDAPGPWSAVPQRHPPTRIRGSDAARVHRRRRRRAGWGAGRGRDGSCGGFVGAGAELPARHAPGPGGARRRARAGGHGGVHGAPVGVARGAVADACPRRDRHQGSAPSLTR